MTSPLKWITCLWLLFPVGCASLESSLERRVESFETTSFRYEKAIRWGYYDLANDYIRPGDQSPIDYEMLRDFKVSSYEVLKSTISPGELQARQTVEIKYYHVNTMIEKTLIQLETWEFDREKKRWYMTSGLPPLK